MLKTCILALLTVAVVSTKGHEGHGGVPGHRHADHDGPHFTELDEPERRHHTRGHKHDHDQDDGHEHDYKQDHGYDFFERCESLVPRFTALCLSPASLPHPTFLVCASEAQGHRECPLDVPPLHTVTQLILDKSHTPAPCVEGQTYGQRDNAVWVQGGCTATFAAHIAVDPGWCGKEGARLKQQECGTALQEMEMCRADVQALCPGGHPRRHHRHRHHHCPMVPMHWLPAEVQMDPFTRDLAECLQEHADSITPECRQTQVAQFLLQPPVTIVWMQVASILVAVSIALGFLTLSMGYFCWQRRRLQARRGEGAPRLGRWSTTLFTWDWRSLLPSLLFPWCQSALIQADAHNRDSSLADLAMNATHQCMVSNTFYTRQTLRQKYEMPEAPLTDFLASLFCLPCVLAQHSREMEARASPDALLMSDTEVPVDLPVKEPKEASDTMMV